MSAPTRPAEFTTASAAAYELSVGRWSRAIATAFVDWASPDGERLLDVGTGTGHLAHALAEACPNAEITGIDNLPALLEAARAQGHPRCRFIVGDAMHLPFPDACLDFAISQFVLNFVPDPGLAVSQMARVARPGSVVAGAVWDIENGLPAFHFLWRQASEMAPGLVPHYERWRMQPTTRVEALRELWLGARLRDLRTSRIDVTMRFENFNDFWLPASHGGQAFGRAFASLAPEGRAAVASHLAKSYCLASDEGVIEFRATANAIAGVR